MIYYSATERILNEFEQDPQTQAMKRAYGGTSYLDLQELAQSMAVSSLHIIGLASNQIDAGLLEWANELQTSYDDVWNRITNAPIYLTEMQASQDRWFMTLRAIYVGVSIASEERDIAAGRTPRLIHFQPEFKTLPDA